MRWLIACFALLPLALWGCPDNGGTMLPVGDDDAEGDDDAGDDDAGDDDAGDDDAGDDDTAEEVWADADLLVHSPISGEIGSGNWLILAVFIAAGKPLPQLRNSGVGAAFQPRSYSPQKALLPLY